MSTDWATLEQEIRRLPEDLQREVEQFVRALSRRHIETAADDSRGKPTLNWAGALKGEAKTSVELQHEIADLWKSKT